LKINEIISENELYGNGVWDDEVQPTRPPSRGNDLLMRDGENAPGRNSPPPDVRMPGRFNSGNSNSNRPANPYVDKTPDRGVNIRGPWSEPSQHNRRINPEGTPGAGMTQREYNNSTRPELDRILGQAIRTYQDPSSSPEDRERSRRMIDIFGDHAQRQRWAHNT
jgi:hypothetical protein